MDACEPSSASSGRLQRANEKTARRPTKNPSSLSRQPAGSHAPSRVRASLDNWQASDDAQAPSYRSTALLQTSWHDAGGVPRAPGVRESVLRTCQRSGCRGARRGLERRSSKGAEAHTCHAQQGLREGRRRRRWVRCAALHGSYSRSTTRCRHQRDVGGRFHTEWTYMNVSVVGGRLGALTDRAR